MGKAERQQKRLAGGWQALERGDLRAAEETARAAAPDGASVLEVARLLGASLFLQGRFPEATAPLRKVYLETQERNPGLQLGHCYLASGDPKNAQIILERVTSAFPDFEEALNLLGIALIQQGRHEDAVKAFTSALERSPRLPATYNNLGNALLQTARYEEAAPLFQKAIALEPGSFQGHNNLGRAYKALRRYDASLECYREALRLAPDNHEVHNNLGTLLADIGRHEEAIDCYRTALAINPRHPLAHNNLGVALDILGRHIEAVESFRTALGLSPEYVEAYTNLGIAYQQLKRFDEAIICYEKAIALKPDDAGAHNSLGLALQDLGRLDEAITCHRRALSISPDFADAHTQLGVAYQQKNLLEEAIECHRRALAIRPDHVEAQVYLGIAYQKQMRLDEAIACYERAISSKPDHAEAHANLGALYLVLEQLDRAIASCQKAISLKPDLVWAHFNLGLAFQDLKRLEEAVACFEKALALNPDQKYAFSALAWTLATTCEWGDHGARVEALRAHVREGRSFVSPLGFMAVCQDLGEQKLCAAHYLADVLPKGLPAPHKGGGVRHEKIRVAYLSADFRDHPVGHCTRELFRLHDRSKFEVFGVSFGVDDGSEIRSKLETTFDRFLDVRRMSDSEVAGAIRDLGIDIAVDLMGYTKGCRPGILAHRPAPIQVNYLGYPGTTGSDFIDYILADRFIIPEEDRKHYSENVAYLPESYMANHSLRVVAEPAPSRSALGLPQTAFVFCCFNNSYKITPDVFDAWMRLLHKVAGSVLWLSGDNPLVEGNLRREAVERGIDPGRLIFAHRLKNIEEHYARYRLADLFLDTAYNGHVTASDALWAGLPVLTCAGRAFAGRVAGGMLNVLELPELITTNLVDYEGLALSLATDPQRLTRLREKLDRARKTGFLFDADRFRRHIESAYTTMWETWQRGEPPRAFAVDPAK